MSKRIKIYGERNTNTNYMSKLLELNLDVNEMPGVVPAAIMKVQNILPGRELIRDLYFQLTYRQNLGWKHTCVKTMEMLKEFSTVDVDLCFLTITKNPYSWLLSLYRRPYHQDVPADLTFEDFLRRPWQTTGRDNVKIKLANPIELWNVKNRSYLQLTGESVLNITSESLFLNPEDVVEKISRQFSIRRLSPDFVNYERSTKDSSKDSHYYQDYYLNEKWRGEMSAEAIATISSSLDTDLVNHFGYRVLI
jgi:hypothetical protein